MMNLFRLKRLLCNSINCGVIRGIYAPRTNQPGACQYSLRTSGKLSQPHGMKCNLQFSHRHKKQISYWKIVFPPAKSALMVCFRWAMRKIDGRERSINRILYRKYVRRILATVGVCYGGYLLIHIERTPITERLRIMIATDRSVEILIAPDTQDSRVFPENSKFRRRTEWVFDRLLTCNKELLDGIKKFDWKLEVIDNYLQNADSTWDGQIRMHGGFRSTLEKDDQLAMVLAHEIAHVILEHTREEMSMETATSLLSMCVDIASIVYIPQDWVLFLFEMFWTSTYPSTSLTFRVVQEYEADIVGMQLAARAGYSPPDMLGILPIKKNETFFDRLKLYFKGYPSSALREQESIHIFPKAMEIQRTSSCARKEYVHKETPEEQLRKPQLELRNQFLVRN